jgi:hypothetical protein
MLTGLFVIHMERGIPGYLDVNRVDSSSKKKTADIDASTLRRRETIAEETKQRHCTCIYREHTRLRKIWIAVRQDEAFITGSGKYLPPKPTRLVVVNGIVIVASCLSSPRHGGTTLEYTIEFLPWHFI